MPFENLHRRFLLNLSEEEGDIVGCSWVGYVDMFLVHISFVYTVRRDREVSSRIFWISHSFYIVVTLRSVLMPSLLFKIQIDETVFSPHCIIRYRSFLT